MTTPEHTLVGILGAISIGLHRRFGWPIVGFVAVVSNLPDLDGLPMLIDMSRFESGHRVWGHNLTFIVCSSLLIAWVQYRFGFVDGIIARLKRFAPSDVSITSSNVQVAAPYLLLCLVAVLFQVIHLGCDIIVSGGEGLSDWEVLPFWPFHDAGVVFPLIPWGDLGPTVIMMSAAVLMAAYRSRTEVIATSGLMILTAYMLFRGWQRGVF